MGFPPNQEPILSFVQEPICDVQSDLFAHNEIRGGLAELSDFSSSLTCPGIYTTRGAGTSVYSRPSGTQSRLEEGIGALLLVGQWVQPDGGDSGL